MKLWREISFTAAKAAEIPRAITEDFINLAELCKKKKNVKKNYCPRVSYVVSQVSNLSVIQVLQQDTGGL